MASRKEDEKNEKIIRALLKQPANRKCVNCNSLGPQYVCITFWTFVCTNCSGIHREFTHRVKSVSMAKFTSQEVASLQAGGNERAKEIYFKELDPYRALPDSSNVDRLRDFIKHVYVDRRYTGERSVDRPPRVKMGDKEESYENRRSDAYQSGSRSPPYDDAYERRYSGRSSPGYGGRSPGYDQDNQRHSDYGKSPVHTGVINDWKRDDRFANGRRSEDRRSSDGESRPEGRSPDRQKDIPSPPVVRPVREILGENVSPIRIIEPPKATQRTASSSSLASSNGNPVELRREASLIDFDADPEPPVTAAASPTQQSTASQPVFQSTNTASDDNWACFDNSPETKVSQAPPNVNPLESVLAELSVPAPVPAPAPAASSNGILPAASSVDSLFGAVGNAPATPFSVSPSVAVPVNNASLFPHPGVTTSVSPATNFSSLPYGVSSAVAPGIQHQQQPFVTNSVSHSAAPQSTPFSSVSGNWGLVSNSVVQASLAAPNAAQDATGTATQTAEAKSSARKELPAEFFTATYPSVPYAAPGWQAGLVPGMAFPLHYNPAAAVPTFPQPAKSMNPFDVNNEASPVQNAAMQFPSMTSLQAALPNMAAPSSFVHAANLGTSTWMPPQPSTYSSAASFTSTMPGTYPGQQLPSNMIPSRPQGYGPYGNGGTGFGSLNANMDLGGKLSTPTATNPSFGGNPF